MMGSRRGARRVGVLLGLLASLSAPCGVAFAQVSDPLADSAPTQWTGTLLKLQRSGSIAIGYRAASIPFAYLSARGEPVGYTIDLCRLLVDRFSAAVDRPITIRWVPVTPESRIADVTSGRVDMECGSTTSNVERKRQVAFSQTVFVAGTKLMVAAGSPIRSFRDLTGRTVVVTAGTTNETALRNLASKFRLDTKIVVAPDHTASFAMLAAGEVDAFATDDVLLHGLLAQNRAQSRYVVIGEFLSYDPYGIVFRKDDPAFAQAVDDGLRALATDHEIQRRYTRWFLQPLPSGVSLDLPMSPQLETLLESMGGP